GGFGDECPTAASCHFTDARLMAWVKHHFSPNSSTDPWLGVGLGYEWLSVVAQVALEAVEPSDRKSTRLNSSHVKISYAVFCLKSSGDHRDLLSFPTRRSSDLGWFWR